MGILDHTRILDTIVTNEGRRQMASGKLRAEFFSFSDVGAVYAMSDVLVSGTGDRTDDIATRFTFESGLWAQDQVTFESDDSGKLFVKELRSVDGRTIRVLNGQLFSGSVGTGSMAFMSASSVFNDTATLLLSSSVDSYQNLQIIGSPDLINDRNSGFELSQTEVSFAVTDELPIPAQASGGTQEANINNIESLFADKRMSHVQNFAFLPPVNKPRIGTRTTTPIGIYSRLGQRPLLTMADVNRELATAETQGFSRTIKFTKTSDKNRVFGQMFEVAEGRVTKLDVIDFGLFSMSSQGTTHVLFVGKLYMDDFGSHTFVNMFTLVFEDSAT